MTCGISGRAYSAAGLGYNSMGFYNDHEYERVIFRDSARGREIGEDGF